MSRGKSGAAAERPGHRRHGLRVVIPLTLGLAACGPDRPDVAKVEAARARAFAARMAKQEAAETKAAVAAFKAAPDCDPSRFKFIMGDHVSHRGLARDAQRIDLRAPGRSIYLGYHPFDPELAPHRRDWVALGLISVGSTPGEREMVDGTLWVKDAETLSSGGGSLARQADGVALTVETALSDEDPARGAIACVSRFHVKLTRNGVLQAGSTTLRAFR